MPSKACSYRALSQMSHSGLRVLVDAPGEGHTLRPAIRASYCHIHEIPGNDADRRDGNALGAVASEHQCRSRYSGAVDLECDREAAPEERATGDVHEEGSSTAD